MRNDLAPQLALAAAMLVTRAYAAPQELPDRIVIDSHQLVAMAALVPVGATRPPTHLVITRGASYSDGIRVIDEALVVRLMQAIDARSERDIEPSRFSATRQQVAHAIGEQLTSMPANMRSRVAALASDPDTFDRLERSALCLKPRAGESEQFGCPDHTDDEPTADLILSFKGGQEIRVSSRSQHPMMRPWKIERERKSVTTFAPELPRAIAALLPDFFPNRYRIGDESVVHEVAERASWMLMPTARAEDAEARFGKQLAQLRARFTINDSSVDSEGPTPIWRGTLRAPAKWPRIEIKLSLTAANEAIDPRPFLRDVDALVRRLYAVHWDAQGKPVPSKIQLIYADNRSLPAEAAEQLLLPGSTLDRSSLAGAIIFLVVGDDAIRKPWLLLRSGSLMEIRQEIPSIM